MVNPRATKNLHGQKNNLLQKRNLLPKTTEMIEFGLEIVHYFNLVFSPTFVSSQCYIILLSSRPHLTTDNACLELSNLFLACLSVLVMVVIAAEFFGIGKPAVLFAFCIIFHKKAESPQQVQQDT